jgi:coxsackievirus/adenovirus receptor
MLKKLSDQLEYIKNYPEVIQDLSFQFRLRELLSLVDGLLKDTRYSQTDEHNIIKSIQDLKDRIQKLTIIRDQITQLPEIEKQLIYSSSNMSIIDDIIKQIQSGVDNSRKFLDNQGIYALQKAWDRSSKFGRQSERLSEIAREARHLADEQYLDANEVFKIATKSLNTSQTAFKLAKDAVSTQEIYKNAMEKLRKQWTNTQSLIMKISKIAEEAHREALKAYNDALDLYSKSSLDIPLSRSERINQDVNWAINQALKIMSEVDKLLEKYEITLNGNLNKLTNARQLLEQAQQLQAITNKLLQETQEGYNKALAAFESGELTLKDAQNTLRILKEFDDSVAKSKLKAEEALKKFEEIHNLIKEAEVKTDEAEKALKGIKLINL